MKAIAFTIFLGAFFLLTGFDDPNSSGTHEIEKGMIKVTVLYPNGEGNTFNREYYAQKHMPNHTNTQPVVQIGEVLY